MILQVHIGGSEIFVLLIALGLLLIVIYIFKTIFRSPRLRPNKGTAKGTVRDFNATTETFSKGFGTNRHSKTLQVIRFMLQRFDENGKELPNIAVEMRGQSISGFMNEGHQVEIFNKIVPGRIVLPTQLYNHTSQSAVKVLKR